MMKLKTQIERCCPFQEDSLPPSETKAGYYKQQTQRRSDIYGLPDLQPVPKKEEIVLPFFFPFVADFSRKKDKKGLNFLKMLEKYLQNSICTPK